MSDWRSLKWKSGRLISSYALARQGVNADGREGVLPLEGAHIAPIALYFRNTQTNGIGTKYDAIGTAGTSGDTSVTTTTASGTEIQATKTAGGSVVEFISGRTPVGGATFTHAVIYFWAKQSADTVNAGLRFRLYKRSTAGAETELIGSPFDKTVELTTDNTRYEITCDFTDVALLEDERIVIKPYIVNVGTMGAGTSTLNFNGAVGVGGGGAPGLSGSYTNETTAVNLTTLGSEDFIAISSTGTTIRKTGGGSLITAVPWDFVSDASASANNDGADQDRQFTTTDATPSNITNDTGGQYTTSFNAAARNGWKITAPAGTGERVLKVYLGHFYTTGATGQLHLTASISGAGAPSSIDLLPSQNVNADTELTATITYTAGQAGQTITLEYRPDAEASDGLTRYLSFRAAWVGPAGSGVPYADSYINVYPAVTFKAESGGAVNADITESLASSELSSALAAFSASTTESITTSETESAIASFGVSASESVAASELASVSVNTFVEITEAATASETLSAGLLSTGGVTEPVTASEAQSATVTHAASIAETVTAAEAQSAQANFIADTTESVSTDSSQSSTIITEALITEPITATETSNFGSASSSADITESISIVADQSAISQLQSAITETITAGESSSSQAVFTPSITETLTMSVIESANYSTPATITESSSADSSQDSSFGSTNLYSDIEEIFASDELSVATYQTNSNIIESTSVIDASFTDNIIVADVTESVNLTDTYSVIVKLVKRAVSSVLAIRDLGTGLVKRVLSSNLTERDVDSNLTKRDVDSNLDEREP